MPYELTQRDRQEEAAFQHDRDRHLANGDLDQWRVATLILADWLEDHNQPNEAANLRKEADQTHPPKPADWPINKPMVGLTSHQFEQLRQALRRPMGILCGSPGTGKTTTLAALVRELPAQHTAVCAPTGKAAVRIAEALQTACPGTMIQPSTIHQLLGIERAGYDGGGWSFTHDEGNPLPYEYLVVDEASMLATDLAAALLRACRPGTHVLFVGDPDQLPPVGHGAPLRDWIGVGIVPVGRLTEVHRNGGAIAGACRAIREQDPDGAVAHATAWRHSFHFGDALAGATAEPARNWIHVECSIPSQAANILQSILAQLAVLRDGRRSGLDPDVQILAPMRERGPLSCKAVNKLCQDLVNPDDPSDPAEVKAWGTAVRPGDRVVCLRNHIARDSYLAAGHYVANGEIGVIQSTGSPIIGRFDAERTIRMPRGEDDAGFSLGYCLTVHKFQGSESPVTIVLLDESARAVVGREWVYTALSRARRLCITVGRLSVIRRAITEPRLEARHTFLEPRIREEVRRVVG